MKDIAATLIQGYGVASGRSETDRRFPLGTIKMQEPFFKERGVDLAAQCGGDFVFGTLNLSIAPRRFTILKPEYFLEAVRWTDLFPPENFYLSAAQIIFKDKAYLGMLYIPDPQTKPDHFYELNRIEIIAQPIPAIATGDAVTLRYNPEAIDTEEK